MLLESVVCLLIFVVIGIFISNFIIGSSKSVILNNQLSSDTLKMRELEVFLNSEFDEYSFDFKIVSDNKIYYKKIVPISSEKCEVKEREISFKNGVIQLRYDNRNVTNLLRGVQKFEIYNRGKLIFVDIELNDMKLTKVISSMSYNIW